ncbi:DUF3572 family protein [Paracoccus contaminans]|nr:DUF3572 family protein [Paracoccus contaminans]
MMNRDSLDRLTQDLLDYLGEQPALVGALAADTGLDPADLRRLARGAALDLSVALVDFICGDDSRLLAFCAHSGWAPERVAYARAALEAGQLR